MDGGGILGFRPLGMRYGGMTEIDIPLNVLKYRKLLEAWGQMSELGAPLTGNPPSIEEWEALTGQARDSLFGQVQIMVEDRLKAVSPNTTRLPINPAAQPMDEQPLFMQEPQQALDALREAEGPVAEPAPSGYRYGGMLNRHRGY